jgi:single-strand DNA-binding protein
MYNHVVLIGNVATDIDVKASQTGTYVSTFRLATNEYAGKAEDGSRKEATEFHNIVAFGKTAEFVGNHVKKGRAILVSGKLRTSSWEDAASGTRKYKTEVVADEVKFVGQKPQEEAAAA